MKRKFILSLSGATLGLMAPQLAFAQTAVQRSLPPPPPSATTPAIVVDEPILASDDATPVGAKLRAIVLLDNDDTVVANGVIYDGVDATRTPLLDTKHAREALGAFIGEPLSRKLIAQISSTVARQARAKGYPFVSLSAPEQELTSGVLQLRVTEFHVGKIAVKGISPSEQDYILDRIRVAPGERISSPQLSEDLDWLNRNPFEEVAAQFRPAAADGGTDLTIAVKRQRPIRAYAGWSNSGSQTTGIDRIYLGVIARLPVIPGAYASYQLTGSSDMWVNHGNVLNSQPRYVAHGLRAYIPTAPLQNIEFTLSDALTNQVINSDFTVRQRTTEAVLGYRSALSTLGLPAGSGDLLLGIEAKRQHRQVFFGPLTALEVSADIFQGLVGYSKGWLGSGRQGSASINFHVSPGDVSNSNSSARLAAMTNGRITSNQYAYVTFDLSGATRLPGNFAVSTQLSAQYAHRALPLSAQIGLGGDGLVRGYTADDGSFDKGLVLRNDLRAPPISIASKTGALADQLTPYLFVDIGYGRDLVLHNASTIIAGGVGGDYRIGRAFTAGATAAWALKDGQRTQSGGFRLLARTAVSF